MSIESNKATSKNKKISLNKMLNNEYFFHRSSTIKMALNTNRLVDKFFRVNRVKPKVNSYSNRKNKTPSNSLRKIKNNTYDDEQKNNLSENSVPYKLAKILENNEKYFNEQNNIYKSLKEENDNFLKYWHYIKKCRGKTKIKNLKKNDTKIDFNIELNDIMLNNSNYNKNFYLNNKKITQLFKKNPLLTKNFFDNFFYYISEMKDNKNNNDKLEIIKNKVIMYLEKLNKNLTQKQSQLNNDHKFDNENSNDLPEFYKKINEKKENIELLKTIEENKNIKKMIKRTKTSLYTLKKSLNNFEDLLSENNQKQEEKINNKNLYGINFMTPQSSKLRNTSSTWFVIPDKKPIENNISFLNKTNKLNNTSFKNRNKTAFRDDKYKTINLKGNKFRRLNLKKLTSLTNKEKNKNSQSNENSKYNSEDSGLVSSNRLKKQLTSKNVFHDSLSPKYQNFSFKKLDLNIQYSDRKNDKYKIVNKISDKIIKLIRSNSAIPTNLNKNFNKNLNNKLSIKNSYSNKTIQDEYSESKTLKKLYEKIKNKKTSKLTKKEVNMISQKLNINNKQINYYNNIEPLELIKKVRIASNRINLPFRMRKLHGIDFNYKIVESLKPTEKINNIIENLDKKYMEEFIDFKARSLSNVCKNNY